MVGPPTWADRDAHPGRHAVEMPSSRVPVTHCSDSQVSDSVAQMPPSSGETTMSMKSHMPVQRPGPQVPRCTGLLTGLALVDTNSGSASSALVVTTT